MRTWAAVSLVLAGFGTAAMADMPTATLRADIDAMYADIERLYVDLHQNPELSLLEEKTAAKLADRMKKLGYQVTTKVGGTGVVAVLKNGAGPTLLIRTDMDALPVLEQTGLPYASKVMQKDAVTGEVVPVMHACGHDVHMAAWIGTATILAKRRDLWKGTVLFVGQPAEERVRGAKAMLKDGLYEKFGKPDMALAFHDHDTTPAGTAGTISGYLAAAADSVDLTFHGTGGHGAYPQDAVDPILIASRFVVAVQEIVSREINPFDQAVITVGSFHGGLKHNIISDVVKLQITVRSYKPEVREKLLAGIERIAKAEALAGRSPKEPEMKIIESTPALYNDPALTEKVMTALGAAIGAELDATTGGNGIGGFQRVRECGSAGCVSAGGRSAAGEVRRVQGGQGEIALDALAILCTGRATDAEDGNPGGDRRRADPPELKGDSPSFLGNRDCPA
jgi:amidohydrolase